jgi:hypothetical protein
MSALLALTPLATTPFSSSLFAVSGGLGPAFSWMFWILFAIGMIWIFWRTVTGREVERRIIFLFMGLTVAGAVLAEIVLPVQETSVVRNVFDTIEGLQEGDRVLLSLDYDPSGAPELQPMAIAVSQHCFEKKLNVCYMTLWGTGGAMITDVIAAVTDSVGPGFPGLVYGTDYCNVGYRAGNEAVLRVIASDFRKTFPSDVSGIILDSLPIMSGINACPDFDYIVAIGSGRPGIKEWVEYVVEPSGALLGSGAAAVSAPQLYPYYPQQMNGMMGGSKGASEYEKMLRRAYPKFKDFRAQATEIMGPQTVAHVFLMLLIIFANISFFLSKKRKGASA